MQAENRQQENLEDLVRERGQRELGVFQKEGIHFGGFRKYWLWGESSGLSSRFLELFQDGPGSLPFPTPPSLPFTELPPLN